MLTADSTIMALDVGEKRIGIAVANAVARISQPLTTIENNEMVMTQLQGLMAQHNTATIVVGWPRGLEGQHTAQTGLIEQFGQRLTQQLAVPIFWQDEALTSRQAETELSARGKPFSKSDIDALAATYILEDFLLEHAEVAT